MELANVATAFGLVFISELGDKTQLAVIGLSARSNIKWSVVVGASAAFVLLTLAASVIGAFIGDSLPKRWIPILAGALFIGIGVMVLRSTIRNRGGDENAGHNDEVKRAANFSWIRTAISTFSLIFVAELGDKSQLAVTTLSAKTQDAVSAFLGASLALIILVFIGVLGGALLSRYVKPHIVELVAGVLFMSIGAFLVVDALL